MRRARVVRELHSEAAMKFAPSRRALLVLAALTLGLAALAACDASIRPAGLVGPQGTPRLVPITPQQLQAQFGVSLDTPLRVRVVDENGRPVRSATVKYNVLVGEGAFSADSTLTNDQGFSEVTFRPLSAGTVVVEARVNGGGVTERVQFTFQVLHDPAVATRFDKVSGDGQSGEIGSVLAAPLVVRLQNADGSPVASVPVTFALQTSAGENAGVAGSRTGPFAGQVTVQSDASGLATAFVRLGTEAGSHVVSATAVIGAAGAQQSRTVSFTATAVASSRVARLVVISGASQTVVIDTIHARTDTLNFRGRDPQPLVVQALDRFGNPVPAAAVSWFVSDGGGRVASGTTFTSNAGIATNTLVDPTEGRNVVVAFTPGADPVQFVIVAQVYEPPQEGGGEGGG